MEAMLAALRHWFVPPIDEVLAKKLREREAAAEECAAVCLRKMVEAREALSALPSMKRSSTGHITEHITERLDAEDATMQEAFGGSTSSTG